VGTELEVGATVAEATTVGAVATVAVGLAEANSRVGRMSLIVEANR